MIYRRTRCAWCHAPVGVKSRRPHFISDRGEYLHPECMLAFGKKMPLESRSYTQVTEARIIPCKPKER